MRKTRQRKIILDELRKAKDHPSADLIYERVREVLPKISLGTVYRNLELLTRKGEILCLNTGNQNRYDGDISDHLHFRCISCGRFEDFHSTKSTERSSENNRSAEKAAEDIAKTGRQVFGRYVEYYGLCNLCSNTKDSNN